MSDSPSPAPAPTTSAPRLLKEQPAIIVPGPAEAAQFPRNACIEAVEGASAQGI